MKLDRIAIVLLLMGLLPLRAEANMWIPSFVQCITSPLISSFGVLTLVLTIPVLLGVSAIEALVVRRVTGGKLWPITKDLLIINIITSVFGSITMPRGTELWPGLPIYFSLTVIAECLLLYCLKRQMKLDLPLRRFFALSVKMNSVSYAILTVTLVTLIYYPQIGVNTYEVKRLAAGKIVLARYRDSLQVLDLSSGEQRLLKEERLGHAAASSRDFVIAENGGIVWLSSNQFVKLQYTEGSWNKDFFKLPKGLSAPFGLSPDGNLVCCRFKGDSVVYDLKFNRVRLGLSYDIDNYSVALFSNDNKFLAITGGADNKVINLKTGQTSTLEKSLGFAFSPIDNRLAWTLDDKIIVRDCQSGRRIVLNAPGSITGHISWSPDGQLIAYIGHVNFFTAQRWSPDVRAVEVKTGKSATLYEGVWMCGVPCQLFWLK